MPCVLVTGQPAGSGARPRCDVIAGVRRADDGEVLVRSGARAITPLTLDITDEQRVASLDAVCPRGWMPSSTTPASCWVGRSRRCPQRSFAGSSRSTWSRRWRSRRPCCRACASLAAAWCSCPRSAAGSPRRCSVRTTHRSSPWREWRTPCAWSSLRGGSASRWWSRPRPTPTYGTEPMTSCATPSRRCRRRTATCTRSTSRAFATASRAHSAWRHPRRAWPRRSSERSRTAGRALATSWARARAPRHSSRG